MQQHSWADIQKWLGKSSNIFIKKLARNDCSWADNRDCHQNGSYIPRDIRNSGFFPPLAANDPGKPHIFDAHFYTFWPSTGEVKFSALKHYSNKSSEAHFTGVPKDEFSRLTPASWLLGGKTTSPINFDELYRPVDYWFMIIDSSSDESESLESAFDLTADFHCNIYPASYISKEPITEEDELVAHLSEALKKGRLADFVREASVPSSHELARQAQAIWLTENRQANLDPYAMDCPGDAIMRISRDIEYSLYKQAERRFRAAQVLDTLTSGSSDLACAVVGGFRKLDAIFLSAAQTRKSRAGLSFERHIGRLFDDGKILYEEQAVISSRRPDFVLPSVIKLKSHKRDFIDAMIVSLKTTLRERWKQVSMERFNSTVVLATVDDRVSSSAIKEMEDNGIQLMVPESLKNAKETYYNENPNVITFREFFDNEIVCKRPQLRSY